MKWIAATLLICCWMTVLGQNATEIKRRAKDFFAAGRYEDAITTLESSRELSTQDEEGRFLLAICYFQVNRLNESFDILKNLTENEKTPFPECWFYLGKIYHARHQFLEAAVHYKMYLRHAGAEEKIRLVVADMVRRCSNGQQLQYQEPKAFVENLGAPVNSPGDEFAPVLSPNHSDRIYFSAIRPGNAGGKRSPEGRVDERSGKYFSDMFFCSNSDGVWGKLQPMPYQLNSPRHEVLLDFNKDGSALIYLKGLDLTKGEIIVDTFRQLEERLVSSDPLLAPVSPQLGDQAPYFYNDTLIFFASNRAGGYGGLDLYKTVFRNGKWTTPENLGSDINTPYDETTPFLSRDGRTLYFSSNHPERSIGGLDVFKSVYIPEIKRWTEAKNLGLPVNSADDDAYFRLALDGFTGFFASDRKDGLGQRDLYIAYFNDYLVEQDLPEVELSFKPPINSAPSKTAPPTRQEVVKLNAPVLPVELKVEEAPAAATNPLFFNTFDDLMTPLNQRLLDEFGLELSGEEAQKLVLTIYASASADAPAELAAAIAKAEKAANYLVERGVDTKALFMRGTVADLSGAAGKGKFALHLQIDTKESLTEKGKGSNVIMPILHEGLHYKIQIASAKGAYKNDLLRQFSNPMVEKTLDFEYYRYTVGAVKTFAEAQRLRQQVVAKGVSSAFVVPYVNGARVEIAQAKRLQNAYPDLGNYLKR